MGQDWTPAQEQAFQKWYAKMARQLRLDPNPDDPRHFYDWRAAFTSGARPDDSGHWPSTFKRLGHPRLVIDGMDTRTMTPTAQSPDIVSVLAQLALRRVGK